MPATKASDSQKNSMVPPFITVSSAAGQVDTAFQMVGVGELVEDGEPFQFMSLADLLQIFVQRLRVAGDIQDMRIFADLLYRMFIQTGPRRVDQHGGKVAFVQRQPLHLAAGLFTLEDQ